MKKEWIDAFGSMTYGIYVLTSCSGDEMNGMIASWVSQVSYEPPLIMAAVHPNRHSHGLMASGACFGLHVIDQGQKDLLKRFKGPDPAKKFINIDWETKTTGVPILKNCIAWFELEIRERITPGNHTLYIGEVVACGYNHAKTPLSTLDYDGIYIGKS